MLKQVRFQNLGLFNGSHCYKIGNPEESNHGLFAIFVGENGSGKSSIFEFIRRCLSSEITKTESQKCNPDKPAYIICEYEFENEEWKEMSSLIPLSVGIENVFNSFKLMCEIQMKKYVTVGLIYSEAKNPIKYKYLLISSILLLERTFDPDADVKDYMVITGVTSKEKELLEMLDKKNSLEAIDKLIERIHSFFTAHTKSVSSSQERHIKGFIKAIYAKLFGKEGRTSFLFAHRGIGPLDSSLSDKMSRGKQNYEDTVSKAELMAVMLRKIEGDKGKADEDEKAETRYKNLANEILGNESFEFKAVGRNNVIMIDKENNNAEVELLKAPEGVYEAHVIALLLTEVSKDKYFTLCLDEPNKCMHPAQVERLREILLRKIKDGRCSIVCSTHSRDMISFDTWKHVHYFRKLEGGNLYLKQVPHDTCYVDMFTRGSQQYGDILFARRCLFLEGISDCRFFNTLLRIWDDENYSKAENDPNSGQVQHFQGITVLELGGSENWKLVKKFCINIGIPFLIWLDANKKKNIQAHIYTWDSCEDMHLIGRTYVPENEHTPSKELTTVNKKDFQKMSIEKLQEWVENIIKMDKANPGEISRCKEIISNKSNFEINEIEWKNGCCHEPSAVSH